MRSTTPEPKDKIARRMVRRDDDDCDDANAPPDALVPDPRVALEFGITLMTLLRSTKDTKLGSRRR